MRVRTTRITLEHDTLTIIRRAGAERSWCPLCAAEVDVVTIDSTALAEAFPESAAESSIAIGDLHALQDPGEPARLCLPSLLRCFERQQSHTHFSQETR